MRGATRAAHAPAWRRGDAAAQPRAVVEPGMQYSLAVKPGDALTVTLRVDQQQAAAHVPAGTVLELPGLTRRTIASQDGHTQFWAVPASAVEATVDKQRALLGGGAREAAAQDAVGGTTRLKRREKRGRTGDRPRAQTK